LRRSLSVAAIAAAAVLGAAGSAAADHRHDPFTPGSSGLGDPLYPLAGNGGYDVRRYSIEIDYDRATNHMDSEAEIKARATQSLSSFNLDLRGFEIPELEVNGRDAEFTRDGQELTVIPRKGIRRGQKFEVEIEYSGTPERVIDPDGSSEGWVPTSDGAFVVNEPQGSPGWYPSAHETFDEVYAQPESEDVWSFPAAAPPDAASLFHAPVYDRGAMTLQALRVKVGDRVFFDILRTWYRENRYGNATTADFVALAERKSGMQLDDFFQLWLYTAGKPAPGSW
jgi:hypothetical protein